MGGMGPMGMFPMGPGQLPFMMPNGMEGFGGGGFGGPGFGGGGGGFGAGPRPRPDDAPPFGGPAGHQPPPPAENASKTVPGRKVTSTMCVIAIPTFLCPGSWNIRTK